MLSRSYLSHREEDDCPNIHVFRDCSLLIPIWLNVVPIDARDRFFRNISLTSIDTQWHTVDKLTYHMRKLH